MKVLSTNTTVHPQSINHFGHVILTDRLLPLLKSTAEKHNTTVRIVNLSSSSHADAPKDSKFDSLDDINRDLGPNKVSWFLEACEL